MPKAAKLGGDTYIDLKAIKKGLKEDEKDATKKLGLNRYEHQT